MTNSRLRAQSNQGWLDAIRQLVTEATASPNQSRRLHITEEQEKLAEGKYQLKGALRINSL